MPFYNNINLLICGRLDYDLNMFFAAAKLALM